MNIIVDNVLQHLESPLSAEFDYSNVHESLDFLFRKSLNGKELKNDDYLQFTIELMHDI